MADLLKSVQVSFERRRAAGVVQDIEQGNVQLIPAAAAPGASKEEELERFQKEVKDIEYEIGYIKAQQDQLQHIHDASKTLVKTRDVQHSRQAMQDKIFEVNRHAQVVRERLRALDTQNARSRQVKGQGEGSATDRIRTNATAALRKKLQDQMDEFSAMRTQFHEDYRTVVERRVYTVTGQHLDEEQVDKIIDSGNAETIVQTFLHTDRDRRRVEDTLAEITERHRGVQQLERSIAELLLIYQDMAVLVQEQGVQLDNIEAQVARAGDHVQEGTKQVVQAKVYQTKSRKLMLWMLLVVFIIAIIVVIAVVLSVRPWQ